jgi:ankyrin repeat protein
MHANRFLRAFLIFITIVLQFVFADANLADTLNNTLDADFIKAAFAGEFPEVKRLLDKGANVNAKRDNGVTALMGASIEGHQEVVELLLAKGADVDAKVYFFGHSSGATACDLASEKGHKEIVKLLVRAGAFHEEKEESVRQAKIAAPETNQSSKRRRD